MSIRRHVEDEAREDLEQQFRQFRDAFELEDDEPIDFSAFEIWRRQMAIR